jgi:hypothetical protein
MATLTELQADRAAIYAARLSFLKGEMVKEVARDGRRLVRSNPSLRDLDAALTSIDLEIAKLTAATDGTRRRRAISVGFG